MTIRASIVAGVTVLLWAPVFAQTALFDHVEVDFHNSVNVNGKVLPAGHYEIRQLRSSGQGSRILFVDAEHGVTFKVSGATIPIVQNQASAETKIILQRIGQNYYLSRIWISGKDYGYEFPLPAEAKSLMQERAEPITLTASYRPQPVAEAATTPAPAPPPEATPAPAPPPAAAPPQAPPPSPAPPAPEAAPAPPPPQPAPAPSMPATADNWATFVTVGGALAALGLLIRRK